MNFPAEYTPVKGKYPVADRDKLFDRIAAYPDPADGEDGQVPTFTADGILWQPVQGGGDQAQIVYRKISSFSGWSVALTPQDS